MSNSYTVIENLEWKSIVSLRKHEIDSFIKNLPLFNSKLRKELGLRVDPICFRLNSDGVPEVKTTGIAGTASIGKVSLNIVPKFAINANGQISWSLSSLLLMQHARKKDVSLQKSNKLGLSKASYLDHLAIAFLDALRTGLSDQLIHTYSINEQSLPVLRGRLNFSRQMRNVFLQPHLLECDVDELDAKNGYNNLLNWAIVAFSKAVRTPQLKRAIKEFSFIIPGKPDPRFAHLGKRLRPPPQFKAWKEALDIAVFLYQGLVHKGNLGLEQGYSFLFNMERLFEHFVEKTIERIVEAESGELLSTVRQDSILYAKPFKNTKSEFYSKPDNVIYENGKPSIVVDAKYKKLSDSTGEVDKKPINSDIYEIVSALTAHNCKIGLLVYPQILNDKLLTDHKLKVWTVESCGVRLFIGAIAINISGLNSHQDLVNVDEKLSLAIKDLMEIDSVSD